MSPSDFPTRARICFAHTTYQIYDEFQSRGRSEDTFDVRKVEALPQYFAETEVLCISSMWQDAFLEKMPKLRFIQTTSAGIEQFDLHALKRRGVRLSNARGLNANAVAEHGIGLMLSLTRQLHLARDLQNRHQWRAAISERTDREGELAGRTLVIVGLGTIGNRLATLAQAFGMHVIGVKRSVPSPSPAADAPFPIVSQDTLREIVPSADFVCLCCPLTPETRHLINAEVLAAMRADTKLINLARGPVVDEPALIHALQTGVIGGAALDCVYTEPLPSSSVLWDMPNVIITPHSAGETNALERRYIDQLIENLARDQNGETLINEIALS